MVCIYCGTKTEVTNSRFNKRTNSVWRRRHCPNCGQTVSSYENIDLSRTWRVAQSAPGSKRTQLVDFSRDRLLVSVYKSCAHRPSAAQDASELTGTIIVQLRAKTVDGLLQRNDIAQAVFAVLTHFDQAAATHYRAFHPAQLTV